MKRQNYNDLTRSKYSWLEIDLKALESNYRRIKRLAGESKKIMAVVKADAYGHGMVPVSKRLVELGVAYLAVASLREAITLRKSGIDKPILLLNVPFFNQISDLLKFDVTATVSDFKQAKILSREAKRLKGSLKVHIEIDTGMGRCGIWQKEARETIVKITRLANLDVEGLYSHFPCSDNDLNFTGKQIINFKAILNGLRKRGIGFKFVHISNSAGIVNFPNLEFNMVRPGIILYGLAWQEGLTKKLGLKPVMSFKARVVFIKKIEPGRSVGYCRTFIAKSSRLIATLAAGYADGYNRLLSNRAYALVQGRRSKVTGRVCMDHVMVDVTGLKNLKIGDEAVLIGRQGREEVSAQELADLCGTITYEIACSASKCADRFYKD